ncbi:hypothetical protein GCM10010390_15130 [Streptomyces mordarskii]|uniref:Uncharacterized protein n=1 Tax=Streptomyces mordarskii TaxID=1226758 RepID=A0ABP3M6A4_9ACTN
MGCQAFADPRVVAGGDGRERQINGSRFGDPTAAHTDSCEDGRRAQIPGEHDSVRDADLPVALQNGFTGRELGFRWVVSLLGGIR